MGYFDSLPPPGGRSAVCVHARRSANRTARADSAATSSPGASAPTGEKACAGAAQPNITAASGSMLLVKPMANLRHTHAHTVRRPSVRRRRGNLPPPRTRGSATVEFRAAIHAQPRRGQAAPRSAPAADASRTRAAALPAPGGLLQERGAPRRVPGPAHIRPSHAVSRGPQAPAAAGPHLPLRRLAGGGARARPQSKCRRAPSRSREARRRHARNCPRSAPIPCHTHPRPPCPPAPRRRAGLTDRPTDARESPVSSPR